MPFNKVGHPITKMELVYCAVRTEFLNNVQVRNSL